MLGIYFSGTGNTKFCVEKFLEAYGSSEGAFSIEEKETLHEIERRDELVIGYPVQYSSIPKIMRDYVAAHSAVWKGKRVFVIATMGLFSGDGAGMLARLLQSHGAVVTGGLHLTMPDSIGDVRALKRGFEKNRELVARAVEKTDRAARGLKSGNAPQEGLGVLSRLAGLLGQRLYFGWKTGAYTDRIKVDAQKCIGCGVCEALCPMGNLTVRDGSAVSGSRCTMCYRCVSRCPKQAITLLGKRVIEQNDVSKYVTF